MKIRLTQEELEIINKTAREVFGECEVYIFGSRLKDKKGGDIDIFIISNYKSSWFRKKIKLAAKLENLLGKSVDVVVSKDKERVIEKEALKGTRI